MLAPLALHCGWKTVRSARLKPSSESICFFEM